MANFQTLVRDLAIECGASPPNSVTNQKGESRRFVDWIKRANQDIQSKWANWKFLWVKDGFLTVADQRNYAPFEDLGEWEGSRFYIDEEPLIFLHYETTGAFDAVETGKPHTVVVMPDNTLSLYPLPDKAYTITCEYYRAPQVLEDNSDIPLLPEKFHDVIVMRAILKYAYYESAQEVLERVMAEYPERFQALETSQLPGQNHFHNFSMSDFKVEVE